jgi:hypothetical protein
MSLPSWLPRTRWRASPMSGACGQAPKGRPRQPPTTLPAGRMPSRPHPYPHFGDRRWSTTLFLSTGGGNAMRSSKPRAALVLGCAVVCAAAASAAAGAENPHGTPPGQANNAAPVVAQPAAASTPAQTSTPPGQAKKQQAAAAAAQPTTSDNSTGVKPSSTTSHNTTAPAGSNKTKQYGNGQTAGQIAIKNGADPSTPLYGPGNSQPHKVAVCSKNGKTHYVDVHALKSHQAGPCVSPASAQGNASVAAAAVPAAPARSTPAPAGGVASGHATTVHRASPTSRSGVLGTAYSRSKPVVRNARPAQAVLGSAHFTG